MASVKLHQLLVALICCHLNCLVTSTSLTDEELPVAVHGVKRYPRTKRIADRHFASHGPKYPSPEFLQALNGAAAVVSGRKTVILSMANDVALQLTVPIFLSSLHNISHTPSGTPSSTVHPSAPNSAARTPEGSSAAVALALSTRDLRSTDRLPQQEHTVANGSLVSVAAGAASVGPSWSRRLFQRQRQLLQDGSSAPAAAAPAQPLSHHAVIAVGSEAALALCSDLSVAYGQRCVLDADAVSLGNASLAFHSVGFNLIGFARIKYILHAVSAGLDVLFLDTDVVVWRNPLPHVAGTGADIASVIEKCRAVDAATRYVPQSRSDALLFNIGVVFFRASPGVVRCVYSWIFDMWNEVEFRIKLWDQDIFNKVMHHCTRDFDVRMHALDPRDFNSACYKECGCDYPDELLASRPFAKVPTARGTRDSSGTRVCPAKLLQRWYLMHFPCSGEGEDKVVQMQRFNAMRNAALANSTA